MKRNRNYILLSILSITFTIEADNLLDIYNEALENDPQFKAAEYTYLSGKEIKKTRNGCIIAKYFSFRADHME
jgi:outer membrane protein